MSLFAAVVFLWLIFENSNFLLAYLLFDFSLHRSSFDIWGANFDVIPANQQNFIESNCFFSLCIYLFLVNFLAFRHLLMLSFCLDNSVHSLAPPNTIYSPYRHSLSLIYHLICAVVARCYNCLTLK